MALEGVSKRILSCRGEEMGASRDFLLAPEVLDFQVDCMARTGASTVRRAGRAAARGGKAVCSSTRETRIHIRPVPSAPAIAFAILLLSRTGLANLFSTAWPAPPSVAFGDLYRAVEMANLFADQKTFADATPKEPPTDIMADYEREKGLPGFD